MTLSHPQCKFCGCTERRPCVLTAVVDAPSRDAYLQAGGQFAIDPDSCRTRSIPCAWLIFDPDNPGNCICTAPACVEKAYAEALPLALTIQRALDLGLIVEVAA